MLSSISSLSGFYIGKSEDVERRRKEHWYEEGFSETIVIAHSDPTRITALECYLIKEFLKSNIADKCENKQIGGGNEEKPDYLYVALRFIPRQDKELDDNDIDWDVCEL